MDLPYQIVNTFKSISSSIPQEVWEAQTYDSVVTTCQEVLEKLGHNANNIDLVINVIIVLLSGKNNMHLRIFEKAVRWKIQYEIYSRLIRQSNGIPMKMLYISLLYLNIKYR